MGEMGHGSTCLFIAAQGRLRQENHKFKVILSYVANVKPAWAR